MPRVGDSIEVMRFANGIIGGPTHLDSCFAATMAIAADAVSVTFVEGSGVFGDIDLDGLVSALDLGILLGDWSVVGACQRSDLDGDGAVDASEMGLLLCAWNDM